MCGYSVCTIIHCLDFKTTPPDMSNGFWNMSSVRFLDGNFSRCFTVDVWWTWSKHPQKKVLVNRLPSSNQQLASQWAKRVLEKYSEIPKKKTGQKPITETRLKDMFWCVKEVSSTTLRQIKKDCGIAFGDWSKPSKEILGGKFGVRDSNRENQTAFHIVEGGFRMPP